MIQAPKRLHAQSRPNILIIFADDLGYEAVGAYGGLAYATPEIDTMASQGVTFTRAYTSPVCTPSRVSLHTGLYTSDHGWTDVLSVHTGTEEKVDFTALKTFAQLARGTGYATSVTGKWQLATYVHHPDHLTEAGFDSWCIWQIWSGTEKTERYWDPSLNRDGVVLTGLEDAFGPEVLKDYVIEKMTEARDAGEPFLIVHNEMLPHSPIVRSPDDLAEGRSATLGNMIRYMDKLTGEILDAVDSLGIRENTYVFFIGDNGTDTGATRQTLDGAVSGGKRDLTDAGTHVPFIVWGPASLSKGKTVTELVDITDVFPTVCALAGITVPNDIPLRGRSIVPQMEGRRGAPRHWVHQGISGQESIFDGEWRLRSDGELRDARSLPSEPVVASPTTDSSRARNRLSYLFSSLDNLAGTGGPTTIFDNDASSGVTFTGTWKVSSFSSEHYGADYRHDLNDGQGSKSVRYDLNVPAADDYEIFLRWPSDTNRSTNTSVSVTHLDGTHQTLVNQRQNGGTWMSLGQFSFEGGTGTLTISNETADGYVIADAVGYAAAGSQPNEVYDAWARSHFGSEAVDDPDQEAAVWGFEANPDGDQYPNGVECGLGLNPLEAQDAPAIRILTLNGSPAFYSVVRSGATDLTVSPKISTDLNGSSWTDPEGKLDELRRVPLSSEFDEVILVPSPSGASGDTLFLRYEVQRH